MLGFFPPTAGYNYLSRTVSSMYGATEILNVVIMWKEITNRWVTWRKTSAYSNKVSCSVGVCVLHLRRRSLHFNLDPSHAAAILSTGGKVFTTIICPSHVFSCWASMYVEPCAVFAAFRGWASPWHFSFTGHLKFGRASLASSLFLFKELRIFKDLDSQNQQIPQCYGKDMIQNGVCFCFRPSKLVLFTKGPPFRQLRWDSSYFSVLYSSDSLEINDIDSS